MPAVDHDHGAGRHGVSVNDSHDQTINFRTMLLATAVFMSTHNHDLCLHRRHVTCALERHWSFENNPDPVHVPVPQDVVVPTSTEDVAAAVRYYYHLACSTGWGASHAGGVKIRVTSRVRDIPLSDKYRQVTCCPTYSM